MEVKEIILSWHIAMMLLFVQGNVEKIKYLNLTEGSKCSWNGLDGVCASTYKCRSSMELIRRKNYPPICTFQGVKTIVCCTDCELVHIHKAYSDDTFQMEPGTPGWFYKTGQKARDNCLDYLIGQCKLPKVTLYIIEVKPNTKCFYVRIIPLAAAGGDDAKRDQFRHMALLGYGEDIDSAQWICGGSLISNKFILTAAHCIAAPDLGPVRYAALGILKRSDPLELSQAATGQRYLVKRIIQHPEYQPPSKYHDIALLETTTEVSFSAHVFPACLHTLPNLYWEWDEKASATGWGALGHNRELADTLQTVTLERFEQHECHQLYPPHRNLRHGYNHSTQMCYGHREKIRDTCKGDSGGPLQTTELTLACLYTIIGVTSTGRSCGFAGNSGVYTRVIHYVPWIESIVWPY